MYPLKESQKRNEWLCEVSIGFLWIPETTRHFLNFCSSCCKHKSRQVFESCLLLTFIPLQSQFHWTRQWFCNHALGWKLVNIALLLRSHRDLENLTQLYGCSFKHFGCCWINTTFGIFNCWYFFCFNF